jgi:hypothetical protein
MRVFLVPLVKAEESQSSQQRTNASRDQSTEATTSRLKSQVLSALCVHILATSVNAASNAQRVVEKELRHHKDGATRTITGVRFCFEFLVSSCFGRAGI